MKFMLWYSLFGTVVNALAVNYTATCWSAAAVVATALAIQQRDRAEEWKRDWYDLLATKERR